eukprot:13492004-Ditylum_brightwellii.AAC.1
MKNFVAMLEYTTYGSAKPTAQEAEKKKKYHVLYQENRKNFPLFVATVDGVLGRETKMILKQIA